MTEPMNYVLDIYQDPLSGCHKCNIVIGDLKIYNFMDINSKSYFTSHRLLRTITLNGNGIGKARKKSKPFLERAGLDQINEVNLSELEPEDIFDEKNLLSDDREKTEAVKRLLRR